MIRNIFHYRKFDSTSKTFLENNIDSVYELYFSLSIKKCILNHTLGRPLEIVEFRRNAQHFPTKRALK